IAAINRLLAIGRRMKISESFTCARSLTRTSLAGVRPPSAAAAFAGLDPVPGCNCNGLRSPLSLPDRCPSGSPNPNQACASAKSAGTILGQHNLAINLQDRYGCSSLCGIGLANSIVLDNSKVAAEAKPLGVVNSR